MSTVIPNRNRIKINSAIEAFNPSDFRFQISDFRLQTSDFRLQISDFRLQTSDFRLQISDLKPVNHEEINWNDYTFILGTGKGGKGKGKRSFIDSKNLYDVPR